MKSSMAQASMQPSMSKPTQASKAASFGQA
jgi:hypothetical protein